MVVLYGKHGCGICLSAEDKLNRLGIEYEKVDLEDPPDNWRDYNISKAMAAYQDLNTLPMISIDDEIYTYAKAMKQLKGSIHAA